MSNESKQSSPEQAAKEFSEKEWPILSEEDYYKRGNDEPYYDYSATSQVIQFAIKKGFISGSQWTSPRWVKASERLPEKRGEKNKVVVRGEGFVTYGYRNFNDETPEMIYEIGIQLFCNNNVEWLDETAHPTAVNRDELREAAEGICKNFGRLTLTEIQTILSNALNAQPKAAAPKTDDGAISFSLAQMIDMFDAHHEAESAEEYLKYYYNVDPKDLPAK